jgi:hypothetical protein
MGLFSKKKPAQQQQQPSLSPYQNPAASRSELSSVSASSPTTEIINVHGDLKSFPSSPNGSGATGSASSSKLRFFGRKKDREDKDRAAAYAQLQRANGYAGSALGHGDDITTDTVDTDPRLSPPRLLARTTTGLSTDSDYYSPLPPRLSAAAVFGDPQSSLSTRSLPPPATTPLSPGSTSSPLGSAYNGGRPGYASTSLGTNGSVGTIPRTVSGAGGGGGNASSGKEKERRPGLFHWGKSSPASSSSSQPSSSTNTLSHTEGKKKANGKKSKESAKTLPSRNPDGGGKDTSEGPVSSFNLVSFRHVSEHSQPQPRSKTPTNASSTSLSNVTPPSAYGTNGKSPLPAGSAPQLRPRGMSGASEAQRISVAAFREAQARRSQTASPVPSFRAPSPGPNSAIPPPLPSAASSAGGDARGRTAQAGSRASGAHQQQPSRSRSHNDLANRRPMEGGSRVSSGYMRTSSATVLDTTTTDEDTSEGEEEEDDDSDEDGNTWTGPGRRRTITSRSHSGHGEDAGHSRPGRASKSELGHGSAFAPPSNGNSSSNPNSAANQQHTASGFTKLSGSRGVTNASNGGGPRSQSSLDVYRSGGAVGSRSTANVTSLRDEDDDHTGEFSLILLSFDFFSYLADFIFFSFL